MDERKSHRRKTFEKYPQIEVLGAEPKQYRDDTAMKTSSFKTSVKGLINQSENLTGDSLVPFKSPPKKSSLK